jgi:hypothetical protein
MRSIWSMDRGEAGPDACAKGWGPSARSVDMPPSQERAEECTDASLTCIDPSASRIGTFDFPNALAMQVRGR